MQLGAVYYLVKPFGFAQLREQLTAYRQLRDSMDGVAVANQETVDALYGILRGPVARTADRRRLPATMAQVLDAAPELGKRAVRRPTWPTGWASAGPRRSVTWPTSSGVGWSISP